MKKWLIVVFVVFVLVALGAVIAFIVYEESKPRKLGEKCKDKNHCDTGLVCYSGTCRSDFDQKCSSVSDCVPGALCENVCNPDGTCSRICTGGVGIFGRPCFSDGSCSDAGLSCGDDNVCRYAIGNVCQQNDQCVTDVCQDNLCHETLSASERCESDSQCAGTMVCDSSVSFCQAPGIISGTDGAACSPDGQWPPQPSDEVVGCETPLRCVSRICQKGAIGDPCNVSDVCQNNLICEDGICQSPSECPCPPGYKCVDKNCLLNEQQPCLKNSDCLNNNCRPKLVVVKMLSDQSWEIIGTELEQTSIEPKKIFVNSDGYFMSLSPPPNDACFHLVDTQKGKFWVSIIRANNSFNGQIESFVVATTDLVVFQNSSKASIIYKYVPPVSISKTQYEILTTSFSMDGIPGNTNGEQLRVFDISRDGTSPIGVSRDSATSVIGALPQSAGKSNFYDFYLFLNSGENQGFFKLLNLGQFGIGSKRLRSPRVIDDTTISGIVSTDGGEQILIFQINKSTGAVIKNLGIFPENPVVHIDSYALSYDSQHLLSGLIIIGEELYVLIRGEISKHPMNVVGSGGTSFFLSTAGSFQGDILLATYYYCSDIVS